VRSGCCWSWSRYCLHALLARDPSHFLPPPFPPRTPPLPSAASMATDLQLRPNPPSTYLPNPPSTQSSCARSIFSGGLRDAVVGQREGVASGVIPKRAPADGWAAAVVTRRPVNPSSHRFVGPGKLTLSDRTAGQVNPPSLLYSGRVFRPS
jgi:hypothetical protein